MELEALFELLSTKALLIGLATTRVAVAFVLLPIFTSELVPAMIRSAIFVSFALIAIIVQPVVAVENLDALNWISLFGKEIIIGIAIGVFFGLFLWAFEAAGQVIDMQVGATISQVMDPITGQQTSLTGEFLGRLANFAFMGAGGLLLLMGSLIESFAIWPVGELLPDFSKASLTIFESEFSKFILLTLIIASPIMVTLFMIDSVFGLINRYAQQLNVFFLSMSLKAITVVMILMLMINSLIILLVDEMLAHEGALIDTLESIFSK